MKTILLMPTARILARKTPKMLKKAEKKIPKTEPESQGCLSLSLSVCSLRTSALPLWCREHVLGQLAHG